MAKIQIEAYEKSKETKKKVEVAEEEAKKARQQTVSAYLESWASCKKEVNIHVKKAVFYYACRKTSGSVL